MKNVSSVHGLAMVEFTILLPIFLVILLSTMELGRAFYTYTELEKLTRDSVRYISSTIITGDTGTISLTQDHIDKTSNLIVYGNIEGGDKSLLPALTTDQVSVTLIDNHIQVEIIYPYQPVLAEIPDFFNNGAISLNFNMTSSYIMRVL